MILKEGGIFWRQKRETWKYKVINAIMIVKR